MRILTNSSLSFVNVRFKSLVMFTWVQLYSFVIITISVVRRKILSMLFEMIRRNTFINRKSSYSVRQHTLEISARSKFEYRGQLICISSER